MKKADYKKMIFCTDRNPERRVPLSGRRLRQTIKNLFSDILLRINIRYYELATSAADGKHLLVDEWYEIVEKGKMPLL